MADDILLVEDDPGTASALTRALEANGFNVLRVASADDAIDVLAARQVTGIVVQAGFPAPAGVEVVRRIRGRAGRAPILLSIDDPSLDVAVRAVKSGAFDVVAKETDPYALAGRVRRAVAETAGVSRSGALLRPVFVGRDDERAFLERALLTATRAEGRVVLVEGADGSGKTSLALELARVARERGALVLWGQCEERSEAPAYWEWSQLLRSYLHAADDVAADDLAAVTALVAAFAAAGVNHPSGQPRFRLADDLLRMLRRASASRTVLCVIDDLDRADPGSLAVLRALATQIADARLLVVGTYRESALSVAARSELGRVADHPVATIVRLRGWDDAAVRRYVHDAAGIAPSDAVVDAIVRSTDGTPRLVADVVASLAVAGQLGADEASALRVVIPESRRQAVAARVACLSDHCQHVLGAVAIVGPDADTAIVSEVAGCDDASVGDALGEAAIAGIVVAPDAAAPIRFASALVRDVLYDRLSAAARSRGHARAAEVLETRAEHERPLAAIAHHRLEAATTSEDMARAFGWVVAAAHHAAQLMAHDEAARHYETALRVAERGQLAAPAMRLDVLIELAEVRWRAGNTEAARAVGRRALAVAKETGEPGAVAAAALAFAGRLPGFGAIACDEEVVAELERALAALPPTATALRAMLMGRLAEEQTYLPRRTTDRTLAPRAITLARTLDDPAVLANVLRTTQWSVWTPDDVERRRQLAEEIVALAARTHDPVLALDGELFRLWSALEHGETEVARRQLVLVDHLAERLRLPYYAWMTTMARACLHLASGRLDDAERAADEALGAGDPLAHPTVPLFVGAQRGHVMWHRGRFDELARWITDVVGEFSMLAATLDCSLVITHAEAGKLELARTTLRRFAADDFAGVPRNPMWLMNMLSLADGAIAVGDVEAATRLYPQLAPFALYNCVVIPVWVGAPVAHYMAGLALVLDDAVAARRHFEDALLLEARTGTLQWSARTQLAYARMLAGTGRAADAARARELVASAQAIAAELGLAPVLRIAEGLDGSIACAPERHCRFHRAGDEWELDFDGRRAVVRHRVGMSHLRVLLERPGTPVSVLDLAGSGGRVLVEGGGGAMLDRQAVAEVRGRIAELEAAIDDCAARGAVASDDVRAELAECRAYLGGRGGSLVSATERARPSVTKAIDRAIAAIAEVHGTLGHHLRRHVETGRSCVYVPDPTAPLTFVF